MISANLRQQSCEESGLARGAAAAIDQAERMLDDEIADARGRHPGQDLLEQGMLCRRVSSPWTSRGKRMHHDLANGLRRHAVTSGCRDDGPDAFVEGIAVVGRGVTPDG